MARRRHLIAYDIRDDKRLRAVATCMEGFGKRIQFSVFVSDLSAQELFAMRRALEGHMNLAEDSVMIIDLGAAGDSSHFTFLGPHHPLPTAEAVIV
jgi:CRISPR-associated protein Cas2